MAQPHAKPEPHEFKKHGDPLETVKQADARASKEPVDPIPAPENGGHARSAAAHLGNAHADSREKNGYKNVGSHPTALREPPQEVSRVGKQHRHQ